MSQSQQSSGSERKRLPLPSTKWRAPPGQRGYFEDRIAQRATTREVHIDSSGQTSTRMSAVHIPQTSLGILERTLKSRKPVPAPAALPQEADNDAPASPPPAAETDTQDAPTHSIKNHPLLYWIPKRMEYVWALLKLSGRPAEVVDGTVTGCVRPGCPRGKSARILYRCASGCTSCTWICKTCMVEKHRDRPLDRVEVWLYGEWLPVSLRQLGLKIQFGHWAGDRCSLPMHKNDKFIVIHTNGLHQVSVAFCGCTKKKVHRRDQLLEARWFPATTVKPQTAATFEVLDAFDAHSGAGKDNAYDYYNALEALTDGAAIFNLPDRSKEFFWMAHQHRHLLALKRGGRGHDPGGGIERTRYGELAVICPACPHRGVNTEGVVDTLRKLSPELAEAHEMFNDKIQLAMDCNFRAKNRMTRSTPETSPYLGDGMAYMVPEKQYDEFTENSKDDEMSNCSKFGARIMANLKNGIGLRTTGIGAVFCARHEFFWPNSVGTLVKGERYCTMDFIFGSALRRVHTGSLHLYYDIVCQYTRNLNLRMLQVQPKSFIHVGAQKILHDINMTFGIPKFHNPGHLLICQLWLNLSYIPGTAMTDGEASERAWAGLNPAASSLREMGPGTMRDSIDFFCSIWNWRKFVNIGEFLTRKMEVALTEALDHCEMFTGLYGAIREENAETAEAWVGQVVGYEARDALDDMGRPIMSGKDAVDNPYESKTEKQSLEKARLLSATIAARAQGVGVAQDPSQTAALTNFVLRAFKVEVLQRRASMASEGRTIIQKRERLQQLTELQRQINLVRKDQQWMMPVVFAAIQELEGVDSRQAGKDDYDSDEEEDESAGPRAVVLYLPSELDIDVARTMLDVLLEELKLRFKGMEDWLDILRQQLRVRGTVKQWKVVFSSGQRMATRTINKQRAIQENVEMARDMYRLHRERYATLVSFLTDEERSAYVSDDWEDLFQELEDSDCRPLSSSLLLAIDATEVEHVRQLVAARKGGVSTGQSSYRIPWIWYKIAEGTELELNDDLRVEFVKCRARAMRWVEEVYLLAYEMVRVPEFCRTRSNWWQDRADCQRPELDAVVRDGVRGYAVKQASMFRRHANGFEERFAPSLNRAAHFVRFHGLDGLIKTTVREENEL